MDFVKDKIAVEVQFGKYAFVAYDLFVKHILFYSGGVTNLGIEILPTKTMHKPKLQKSLLVTSTILSIILLI